MNRNDLAGQHAAYAVFWLGILTNDELRAEQRIYRERRRAAVCERVKIARACQEGWITPASAMRLLNLTMELEP